MKVICDIVKLDTMNVFTAASNPTCPAYSCPTFAGGICPGDD